MILFAERMGGVLMRKSVVAMRIPSAKRSCMVSASSIIMLLVLILADLVDVIFVGGVLCKVETSLLRSR